MVPGRLRRGGVLGVAVLQLALGEPGAGQAATITVTTIRVYGHWRLEVTDPDGTLVTVREFHNGLLPQGENALVLLLGGNRSAGGMAIQLLPTTGASPCGGPPCTVAEPRYPATAGPGVAKTLTKVVSTNPASITLSGSIQVPAVGIVGSVATPVSSCTVTAAAPGPSTISPRPASRRPHPDADHGADPDRALEPGPGGGGPDGAGHGDADLRDRLAREPFIALTGRRRPARPRRESPQ
jgi:hypothetical protein